MTVTAGPLSAEQAKRASFAVVESYDEIPAEDSEAESERAVLGSAIQSAAATQEAAAIVRPDQFAAGAHEIVFRAAVKLADDGQPVEPGTVLSVLAAAGTLARVGDRNIGTGGVFLHALIERAGSIAYHAPRVLAAWQQRNISIVLKSCESIAATPGFDPDTHLEIGRAHV